MSLNFLKCLVERAGAVENALFRHASFTYRVVDGVAIYNSYNISSIRCQLI